MAWYKDASGKPVWVEDGPQQDGFVVPPDPMRAAQAAAEEQRRNAAQTRANSADIRASGAEARAQEAADRAQREWNATHNPDGSPKKIRTFKQMPDSAAKRYEDQIGSVAALDRAIGGFQDDFGGNLIGGMENTAQNLFSGIGTKGQAQWWADVTSTDNMLRNALFGASLTAGEKAAYDKTTISPSMDPVQIRDNLNRRREIAMDVLSRRTKFLKANGYDPEAIDALAGEYAGGQTGNVFDQAFVSGGQQQQAAPFGATQGQGDIPEPMQKAHEAYLSANKGRLDPDAYAAFMTSLNGQYGFTPADPESYKKFARDAFKPGVTTSTKIPAPPRKLSAAEQMRNNAVNNPVGAAFAGVADAGGFGIPSALAGDRMRALGDAQPLPMALGQIAGSIGATAGMGKVASLGLDSLARGAPRLAASARGLSPFTKSLATDAAYSGIYGANTGQNPLASAALGAAGSAGGQAAGGALGKIVAGATVPRQAAMLRARGIPLTVAQQFGGVAKNFEDKLTSIPVLGDLINARRAEGMQAFNRAALNEAGRPVGARVQDIGETGVSSLMDQIGNSYDQATAGANVPLDNVFAQDLARVRQSVGALPDDYAARALKALDNRIAPVEQAGQMTGDAYQQAVRGIKGYRAAASQGAPGFEPDYRNVMTLAQDALTAQMQRGGGTQVVDGLSRADEAYRLASTAKKAGDAATNGPWGAKVFTPAQLNNAAKTAQAKYPGQRPFGRLGDAGQAVLPSKVPNSGTADRLAALALPGAAGAAGYSQDGVAGAGAGSAGTLAALAFLNTKTGQKALQKALIDRGRTAKAVGRTINKKKGLFGSATLPFLIEGN